ncbi:hypothetical protein Mrose_02941 [Calidithermus roseus]|uniref:Uncharacterized protein n=1 Tax=Calidithermus roseus TaxID=1644118 RepID=A0A399EJL3_9DEIN|nr:hypothetical protein Mrose_02941 [Calidithermus roseus]
MDEHPDLLQPKLEELEGLEHLQTLVEQRRGIDGDLGPHLPAGVLEGHLGGDASQVGGFAQEGPARGGEDEFGHAGQGFAHQALVERGVLGVHGQDFGPALPGLGPQQRPRCHHALLVGQRHAPPGPHCRPHARQTRQAGDGGHYHVGRVNRDLLDRSDLELGKTPAQLGVQHLVGGYDFWLELLDLGEEGLEVTPCHEPHHPVAPPAAHVQGLGANGPGGAQHNHTLGRRSFGHRPKVYPKAGLADRRRGCSWLTEILLSLQNLPHEDPQQEVRQGHAEEQAVHAVE